MWPAFDIPLLLCGFEERSKEISPPKIIPKSSVFATIELSLLISGDDALLKSTLWFETKEIFVFSVLYSVANWLLSKTFAFEPSKYTLFT